MIVIYEKVLCILGEEKVVIFEGYLMFLEDEELEEEIVGYINDNLLIVDVVVSKVID